MNSFKAFLREKGLYLLCLALVLIATVTGVMAVQTVVRNVKSLTDARQKALEEQTWNQPDALANSPTEDLPIATPMPSPSAAPSPEPSAAPSVPASGSGGAGAGGDAGKSAAASAPSAARPAWFGTPLRTFSGDELVLNETLGDWRTHNGADYALETGAAVEAVLPGTVAAVEDDALWGTVVTVQDASGRLWRYCGLAGAAVETGASVAAGDTLGTLGVVPSERADEPHLHLECMQEETYLDPARAADE